jgi:diguanylate cyclase (GGDEF)-like protein
VGWTGLLRTAARRTITVVRGASRLLLALAVLSAIAAMLFLANLGGPAGPPVLLWLPTPAAAAVLTLVYLRTARARHLAEPTRRLWRHLTVVAVLVGCGAFAQAYDALEHPFAGGQHTGVPMLSFDGAAIVSIIYALYRLPLGVRTRAGRLQIALDASTLMVAVAIFIWHFLTAPMLALGAERMKILLSSLLLVLLALIAIFAVAKVVLSGYRFIDKSALRLFGLAMVVGAFAPLPQGFVLRDRPQLLFTQVSIPAVMFLAAWAGERQRLARPAQAAHGNDGESPRRPYSVLPYLAVAAVDGLLLVISWTPAGNDRVVVAGAVGLTVIVMLRQLTAFQDNRQLLVRLNHGATHDALTQLPNRALFGDRLHKLLTDPDGRTLSVALIDLDDFKLINDTLGHEIGDALLVAVAWRLTGCVRSVDTVARLGGDEFVVILDGATGPVADMAVERIVAALAEPVAAAGHELLVRASIGIADGQTGDDASELLRHADIAMYAAKALDGTRFLHYEPGMAGIVAHHAQVAADLRDAVTGDQLILLFQPIVDLRDGQLTGAEALLRWAHPERGLLAPADFIPAAERSGLIVPVGRWVMTAAAAQLARWSAEHGDAAPAVLNVNVSARELREPRFAEDVLAILAAAGLDPHRLAVEVTETSVLELGPSVENLRRLREYGVRISLDDFGTGHSTLSLLHDCPVDELKLDRSFTGAPEGDRPPLAAAVLQLARTMGLKLVAEGVETAMQARWLLELGYQEAQGYHFGRPMAAAELATRFGQHVPA